MSRNCLPNQPFRASKVKKNHHLGRYHSQKSYYPKPHSIDHKLYAKLPLQSYIQQDSEKLIQFLHYKMGAQNRMKINTPFVQFNSNRNSPTNNTPNKDTYMLIYPARQRLEHEGAFATPRPTTRSSPSILLYLLRPLVC